MEKSVFRFVLRRSGRDQAIIVLITLLSFPIVYMSLELPKIIINDAISGTEFPRRLFGLGIDQIPFLLVLCFAFLGLVILNNIVKFILNVHRGRTGERILRGLRQELFSRVMRTKRAGLDRLSPGETVQIISTEVEPLGGFVAEAFATPIFQGGTLAVYLTFIFVQSPWLGGAAVLLYPAQAFIIPRLQRRVVALTRRRIENIRTLSGEVGESIGGMVDIRANGATGWWLGAIARRLGLNYDLRIELMRRKATIKFVNNVLNQVTPFLFYAIGGYAVIRGQLDLGALVAVLAAYKDLAGPWKELLKFYQTQSDVAARFRAIVERFETLDTDRPERFEPAAGDVPALSPPLRFEAVAIAGPDGATLLTGLNFEIGAGEQVAIAGATREQAEALLDTAARLADPAAGRVLMGGRDLAGEAEPAIAAAIARISHGSGIFRGTVLDNILGGLRPEAGGAPPIELTGEALALAERIGFGAALFGLGLEARMPARRDRELASGLAEARAALKDHAELRTELEDLVEFWSDDALNENASLAENIATGARDGTGDPAGDDPVGAALRRSGQTLALAGIGAGIAASLRSLAEALPAGSSVLERLELLTSDDFVTHKSLFLRAGKLQPGRLRASEQRILTGIALRFIPQRHHFFSLDEAARRAVLKARQAFARAGGTGSGARGGVTVREYVLDGKPRLDRQEQWPRIDTALRRLLAESGVAHAIEKLGLGAGIGAGGTVLGRAQRISVVVLRALIRRPRVILADTSIDEHPGIDLPALVRGLDPPGGTALLCAIGSAGKAVQFSRVIDMNNHSQGGPAR